MANMSYMHGHHTSPLGSRKKGPRLTGSRVQLGVAHASKVCNSALLPGELEHLAVRRPGDMFGFAGCSFSVVKRLARRQDRKDTTPSMGGGFAMALIWHSGTPRDDL